jgi:hypothetical protein
MDKPRTHSQYQLWEWMISAAQLEGQMVGLALEVGLGGASVSKEGTHYFLKFSTT